MFLDDKMFVDMSFTGGKSLKRLKYKEAKNIFKKTQNGYN